MPRRASRPLSTSSTDPPSSSAGAEPLLEVGRIIKPHGIRGEVIVDLSTNRPEARMTPGAVLYGPDGAFEVVRASPHQKRWIVAFAGVADRNQAESLRGTVLSAEALQEDDTLWVHELVGREVVDAAGNHYGQVEAVEANAASDLLVLPGDRLVPLVFVIDRRDDGTVVIDPPPGLFD